MSSRVALVLAFGLGLTVSGCATLMRIPGTTVLDNPANRELIKLCERYRLAMEERDSGTLLALAHPSYFEDSGTPKGDDDYGYEGLKQVLGDRLRKVRSLRYNVEYRSVEVTGPRAQVQLRYDASYQIATEMGDRWERKQNEKRIEFVRDGERWLITAGM